MRIIKRYDLVEYGGYYRDHQMDPADDGEWVRWDDVVQAMGWDCDCDGGDQGDGLSSLPHEVTCPVWARQMCDCITSGNANKPKQHGADPHAKDCRVYTGGR